MSCGESLGDQGLPLIRDFSYPGVMVHFCGFAFAEAAAAVEEHAAAPSLEELGAKMALQHADAVGDGGRGDAEFLGGAEEAPVSGGGLEEAQAVERRQRNHESGRLEPWGREEINTGRI